MTEQQQWLSRKFILYKVFTNLFFLEAVWLYFYRLFITDQQVGLLDGVAFAIGLLAEVPSGALADKYGKDKLVKIGQLLAGSGILIQAFGSSFLPFIVGQSIMMIGVSFASGADEALFFEKLNFSRTSTAWRKLVTRGSQGALLGSLVAVVVGGWLHTINPRLPWLLTGISFIIAVFLIWSVKESRTKVTRSTLSGELKDYFHDIRTGFGAFHLPKLWLYVPIIIVVQGLFYTVGWGLLRMILLDRFTFSPFWGSLVVASSSLITVGVLALLHKYAEHVSEKQVLSLISLIALVSLVVSVFPIGKMGYFVVLALYVGEFTLQPFMSEILNNHAPDQQRATILSVASFLRTLPYVFLAPLIGFLSTQGALEYFFLSWALLIGGAVVFYLSHKKRDENVSIIEE